MPVAKPASSEARVIAHLDMDCFYVQVEQRKQPQLRGLPTAVVQYNEWKGGGLIAVSYEARKYGVKRSMRGDEAKSVCPQIHLVQVPVARDKADLSIYRDAGSEVISILAKKGRCERASIDEVYLDLTSAAETMLVESPPERLGDIDEEALKSHVVGLDEDGTDVKEKVRIWLQQGDAGHNDKLLSCGALIVAELRKNVLKETEFTCSAGIAHNKMLAKLASGLNKPARQTIVPSSSVKEFLAPWPIKKMKQLGGKLGNSLQTDLGIKTVGDLLQFSEQKLQERYGFNTGIWLWNIARGVSGEEVQGRTLPKSHGSGKTFPGPRALRSIDTVCSSSPCADKVSHWLKQLCEELSERLLADLNQNKRIAHTLTLHVRAYKSSDTDSQKRFSSKSCPLRYGTIKIQEDALSLFHAGLREYMGTIGAKCDKYQYDGWGVTGLSISASKIIALPQGTCTIRKFFPSQCIVSSTSSEDTNTEAMQFPERNWNSGSGVFIGSEEHSVMHEISGFNQNEEERKSQDDQGQATSCSLVEKATTSCSLLEQAAHPFSLSDQATIRRIMELARRRCPEGTIQDELQYESHGKEPAFLAVSPASKILDQVKKVKAKETPSILRFLKRPEHACSQLTHELNQTLQEIHMPTCSGGSMLRSGENARKRERWSYDVNEIDLAIVEELPADIQDELRGWMQPLKQHHSAKRSNIASYFLPSKGSNK